MKKIKKMAPVVLAAVMLALGGCGNKDYPEAKSDAATKAIDTADVPTDIGISENDKAGEYEREAVKMVKIGGALYYETDDDSENMARCGNLDGTLTGTADKFEIPQADGEANFSTKGYQSGMTDNTIEIPIDDDWEIFKKIETDADVLKYKYCYILEGRLPGAADDSEYLVLANDMNITFDDAAYRIFGSDTTKFKDIYVLPILD